MPFDKLLHAAVTGFLAAFGALALGMFGLSPQQALVTGIFTALTIGALKELVWDRLLGRGQPEMADMIANGIGAMPVAALIPFA